MSFEAYEVAIHLRLVDQFSGAAGLSRNVPQKPRKKKLH
jgi:hypothetical protein